MIFDFVELIFKYYCFVDIYIIFFISEVLNMLLYVKKILSFYLCIIVIDLYR